MRPLCPRGWTPNLPRFCHALTEHLPPRMMSSYMTRRDFHLLTGSVLTTSQLAGASQVSANQEATSRTLLMVDDLDLLYRSGTRRILHPLTRHGDPVIAGRGKPWEIALGWNSTYRDPKTGKYQLWYQAFSGPLAQERTHRCVICYAESTDGIHWTKPNLGLYSYNGIKDTNIVLIGNGGRSDNYACSVLVDHLEKDPKKRYKMAYFDFSKEDGVEYPGTSVAFSPDGIHWNKYPKAPLMRASYGRRGSPVPFADDPEEKWANPLSISDAVDVIWDPKRKVYAMYSKMWIDGPDGTMYWKHAMGRTESKDFIHWGKPQVLLTSDELDDDHVEFHHSPVFYYNDRYFALLQILNRAERNGIMDIELAVSPDGLSWTRPFRKPFFFARSERPKFDSGTIVMNPMPVMLEDQFRFYYGGYSEGATGGEHSTLTTGIGMAHMPRDRFAGLTPIHQIAQITTKAVDLTGVKEITINADASKGSIRVELLDNTARRLRGFTAEDTVPITGNSLKHIAAWKQKDMSSIPRGQYILRLHLKDAEVFAVTVKKDGAA